MKVNLETRTTRIMCEWPATPSKGDLVRLVKDGNWTEHKVKRVIWSVDCSTREPLVLVEIA